MVTVVPAAVVVVGHSVCRNDTDMIGVGNDPQLLIDDKQGLPVVSDRVEKIISSEKKPANQGG